MMPRRRKALRQAMLVGLSIALAACQAPIRPTSPASIASPVDTEAPAKPATVAEEPLPPPAPARTPPAAAKIELRGADVFARLRVRFADPPCVEDRVVQRWEKIYGRWPPRLRSHLEAILPMMAMVLDELETHHLPGEFALLPIVESWYRPDAGSARTAYGMWQFTTVTARHQGLRIQRGFDERLAPQAATRAAMRYLAELQNHFGDWKLTNMAFNAGEYRLRGALKKQQSATPGVSAASHLPPGLSMTTYEHLAKVQALACLIAQPKRFKLDLPDDTRIEPLQVIALPTGVESLERVAARGRIDLAVVKALNPAFLRGRIVAGAPREILLPRRAAKRLSRGAAPALEVVSHSEPAPAARPRDYRVRRGDTLSAIAQRHRVRLSELLRWNRIDARALLQPGQVLRLEP